MSICWHCHWGWPQHVMDIYTKAIEELGHESPLDYGPGHVVWSDENWDLIESCLEKFDARAEEMISEGRYTVREMKIAKRALEELAAIPLEQRDYEPEDYNGENPEDFPPPFGVVMFPRP